MVVKVRASRSVGDALDDRPLTSGKPRDRCRAQTFDRLEGPTRYCHSPNMIVLLLKVTLRHETEMRIPFNSRVEGVLTGEGRTAKCSVMVNKVIDNDGSERTVSEYISDVKPPLQDGLYTLS